MLFLVEGWFEKGSWDDARQALQARRKAPEVKIVLEVVVPGSLRFLGLYDSKDATSLHKFTRRLAGLQVSEVMPALPLDNVLIVEEMASKKRE